ncbi:GntR family transcriptional regulator, partial [Streptomyces sp. NPDC005921]
MADQDTHVVLARLLRLRDRREPLVAQIAEWVGAGIIEGRLAAGQDLNSVDLSRRFDTSRTPVREALMVLEQEGLVEMKARRRPRVAAPSLQDIRDIYQVRQPVRGAAERDQLLGAPQQPGPALHQLGGGLE